MKDSMDKSKKVNWKEECRRQALYNDYLQRKLMYRNETLTKLREKMNIGFVGLPLLGFSIGIFVTLILTRL